MRYGRPIGAGSSPRKGSHLNRADRVNAWIAAHFGLVAAVMTIWFVLAAWHLIPTGLVTPNGHLIDPSTVDPNGYNVWAYKHLAYSDIYRLYAERGLWSHPIPYVQARIEYPVVTGLFMWAASYAPGLPLQGGLASVFLSGLNLSGTMIASGSPLPNELAGVSILVGGAPAPILAVAPLASLASADAGAGTIIGE